LDTSAALDGTLGLLEGIVADRAETVDRELLKIGL
jgi:hypothetical protein